jgi:electron transfer flavoprotein beta subunit
MDIVVCIKRVAFTQEVDLEIDKSGRSVVTEGLAHVINDWDSYAVEEAILLKERLGGDVIAVTVGGEDDEEVLRRALAMGADRAIRIDPGKRSLDGSMVAKAIASAIKALSFDLVLTGVQADDDNQAVVGIMLAEIMGLSHAAVVRGIEPKDGTLKVRIELEGGIDEIREVRLPALLTIQSGINEPRYVSVMGIRKAAKKELRVVGIEDLDLSDEELTPATEIEEVYLPPETGGAEMLSGDPSKLAQAVIEIMRRKGVAL